MNERTASILREHGADPDRFQTDEMSPGVWTGPLPGDRAEAVWFALRDAFGDTSLWPVLRGEWVVEVAEAIDAAAILAAADRQSPAKWLAFQLGEQRTSFQQMLDLEFPPDIDAGGLARNLDAAGVFAFSGRRETIPWPEQPSPDASNIRFLGARSIVSRNPLPVAHLSLIALKEPWEAPAYLGFGAWNDCPPPEFHVMMLREWHRRFGAVPATFTSDVVECVVNRPPQDEAAAFSLAVEQWLYCPDIVVQGTMSIRRLAIELWKHSQWFFWWD